MTMAACLEELLQLIREFRTAVDQQLQWVVMNTRPGSSGHVLADRFEDWSTEITATATEAERAGLRGRKATVGHLDLDASADALAELHRCLRRAARLFNTNLASPETYAALRRMAGEQGMLDDWGEWADGVAEAIGRCRIPLERAEDGVAGAWARWAEIACTVAASPCTRAPEQSVET